MRSLLLALTLAFSCQSFAAFIPFSDASDSTYGFIDESTGVQWLSLEPTLGLSVKEALSQFTGYSLPTAQQFFSLYDSIFEVSLTAFSNTFDLTDTTKFQTRLDEFNNTLVTRYQCVRAQSCFDAAVLWQSLFAPTILANQQERQFVWGTVFNASGHPRHVGSYLRFGSNVTSNFAYIYTPNNRNSSSENVNLGKQGFGTYLVGIEEPKVATFDDETLVIPRIQAASATFSVSEPSQFSLLGLGVLGLILRRRQLKS